MRFIISVLKECWREDRARTVVEVIVTVVLFAIGWAAMVVALSGPDRW